MLVECSDCGAIVDGIFIAEYDHVENGISGTYTFLKCPKCEGPFVMLYVFDEDPFGPPEKIYPSPIMGLSPAVPGSIQLAYNEARACLRAKAYTATAIMCRKTLEGIANEHKVTSHNLVGALKEMRDKGIIENRLYEWADALRMSGNEAAHDVNITVSQQDAKDILEFTNALLEYVFTFRDKFEKWKARRELRNNHPDD